MPPYDASDANPVEQVARDAIDERALKEGFGHTDVYVTADDIAHLLDGGALYWTDGEYTHSMIFEPEGL